MFPLLISSIISSAFLIVIIIIYNLRITDEKKLKVYPSILILWILSISITIFIIISPYNQHVSISIFVPYTFQYILILFLAIYSLLKKSQSVLLLTFSAFLLMFSFLFYCFALFTFTLGDDSIIGIAFIFGPIALVSSVSGLLIFLFTKNFLKKLF